MVEIWTIPKSHHSLSIVQNAVVIKTERPLPSWTSERLCEWVHTFTSPWLTLNDIFKWRIFTSSQCIMKCDPTAVSECFSNRLLWTKEFRKVEGKTIQQLCILWISIYLENSSINALIICYLNLSIQDNILKYAISILRFLQEKNP